MSDLDAMHYGRTGKNHQGSSQSSETNDGEAVSVGDDELWDELS